MAVAAHQDLDLGPVLADAPDDVLEDGAYFRAARRLARPQDGGDRFAARRLVDVDRQEAVGIIVRIEERQLLAPVHRIFGVVDVELNAPRHLFPAVTEQIDHRRHHPDQRYARDRVLQP